MAVETRQAVEVPANEEISRELAKIRIVVEQMRDELREVREAIEQTPRGKAWAS